MWRRDPIFCIPISGRHSNGKTLVELKNSIVGYFWTGLMYHSESETSWGACNPYLAFELSTHKGVGYSLQVFFSWNGHRSVEWISLKLRRAYGVFLIQLLAKRPGQIRSRNYDVISRTTFDRFFTETVFSPILLAPIDWIDTPWII